MSRFTIKIDGKKQYFRTKTGIYRDAVAAIPAMLDVKMPFDVEIWSEAVMPEYGPYHYRVREDEFGRLVVETLLPDAANGQSAETGE